MIQTLTRLFSQARKKDLDEVRLRLRPLFSLADERALSNDILEFLRADERAADETLRIGAVKCMLALVPDSLPSIVELITAEYELRGEVLFSLFCFLDLLSENKVEAHIRPLISVIKSYMKNATDNAGSCLWMAGHLLGEHLNYPESIQALLEALREARFTQSREFALAGLIDSYPRLEPSDQKKILAQLRQVKKQDPSADIRLLAEVTIERLKAPASGTRGRGTPM